MFLAAALLLQFPVFSSFPASIATSAGPTVIRAARESTDSSEIKNSASSEKQAADGQTLSADASLAPVAFEPGRPVAEPRAAVSSTLAAPDPQPVSPIAAEPLAVVPVYSSPMKMASEQRRRREWLVLSIAQHSAAAFDAWSTRLVLSSMDDAHEANPLLRPFAGNSSMYAAVQVTPVILDFVSRRMMRSRHAWERRTWWLPQSLSTAISLGSGIHNIGVYNSR